MRAIEDPLDMLIKQEPVSQDQKQLLNLSPFILAVKNRTLLAADGTGFHVSQKVYSKRALELIKKRMRTNDDSTSSSSEDDDM